MEARYRRVCRRTTGRSGGSVLANYWVEETGFVDDGSTEELTPDWFRHFFATSVKPSRGQHDDSTASSPVKYVRGDIVEVYTHDRGDQAREQYFDALYQFGICCIRKY